MSYFIFKNGYFIQTYKNMSHYFKISWRHYTLFSCLEFPSPLWCQVSFYTRLFWWMAGCCVISSSCSVSRQFWFWVSSTVIRRGFRSPIPPKTEITRTLGLVVFKGAHSHSLMGEIVSWIEINDVLVTLWIYLWNRTWGK